MNDRDDTEKTVLRLKNFYEERERFFKEHHNRHVSFGDMVGNRWDRAQFMGFGQGASVYDSALILGDVLVGEQTWVGPGTVLDGSGGPLRIGSFCSISAGVQIYTHNSVKWAVTGGRAAMAKASVTIGDNVYIGPNTIIGQGAAIGHRVIIGALSYVDSSIPDLSVAWGRPAKVVGHIVMNQDGADYHVEYL